MLENTSVSESIPLECARKQSAGICLKAFHWKTSESILTEKHSKVFNGNIPESIPKEYTRKHRMDFKSTQKVENARKHSIDFKSVQKSYISRSFWVYFQVKCFGMHSSGILSGVFLWNAFGHSRVECFRVLEWLRAYTSRVFSVVLQ